MRWQAFFQMKRKNNANLRGSKGSFYTNGNINLEKEYKSGNVAMEKVSILTTKILLSKIIF